MVSLLLIGFTSLFIININQFIGGVEDKNEVIIFLDDGVSEEIAGRMEVTLRNIENVQEIRFYSKDEAFDDIKKNMENAEELFKHMGEESLLPDSFRIRIRDIGLMSDTLMRINRMDGIYEIKAPNDFINILTGIKSVFTVISAAVLISLVIVCLVIISNATRASVDMRKREIYIMKLVGAANSFIKIPFFVEGMFNGIIAGAAASVITCLCYIRLSEVLAVDATLWSAMGITGIIPFKDIGFYLVAFYIAVGAAISAVGTVLSTRKYVK